MAPPLLKFLLSACILATGLGCAWLYLRRPSRAGGAGHQALGGERPWRRVGAGICLVMAIMFVLGAHLVDIPARWRPYAVYWIVMLVLLLWLCALALKDLRYTRRVLAQRRANRAARPGTLTPTQPRSEDTPK